jgi:hypothetical protein
MMTVSVLFLITACSTPAPPPAAETGPSAQIHGDLLQVMRGVLYPNSNVIFAAQSQNPAELKQAADASTATDPLLSTYGGWTAVENSGIALAEAANLLIIPGRKCGNGLDAPSKNPDWAQFVQGLRDAGKKAYDAAKAKNQDAVVEAADVVATSCANCHDKYRDVPGGDADRCK